MEHSYNGTLVSNKNESTTDTCNNIESQKHIKQKKSDPKSNF